MQTEAFQPFIGPTGAIASKRIAVTAVAASTIISDLNGEALRIVNVGANPVYLTFHGSTAVAATTSGLAIPANQAATIKRPAGSLNISAIADLTLTTIIIITSGDGT